MSNDLSNPKLNIEGEVFKPFSKEEKQKIDFLYQEGTIKKEIDQSMKLLGLTYEDACQLFFYFNNGDIDGRGEDIE